MSADSPHKADSRSQPEHPGKARFLMSFVYAFRGIASAAHGRNFIVQAIIGAIAVILGFVFGISTAEWIVLILCCGVVLAGECINSAIEDAVDLASPCYDEIAGRSKDMAAGGVLIASIASLIIGIVIFAPRILDVLFSH